MPEEQKGASILVVGVSVAGVLALVPIFGVPSVFVELSALCFPILYFGTFAVTLLCIPEASAIVLAIFTCHLDSVLQAVPLCGQKNKAIVGPRSNNAAGESLISRSQASCITWQFHPFIEIKVYNKPGRVLRFKVADQTARLSCHAITSPALTRKGFNALHESEFKMLVSKYPFRAKLLNHIVDISLSS